MTDHQPPAAAVLCLLLLASLACEDNRAPLKPAPPIGPDSCSHRALVTFRTAAEDPNGDWVRVHFDWGDGSISDWTDWMTCESLISQEHAWHDSGTYEVRARARDIHGAESEWSSPAVIHVDNKAPDFALPDIVGDTVRLHSRLASGPVYIVWWDLPCVNCIAEIDVLQPLYDSLRPFGFTMLAVSVDKAADSSRVRTFVASKGWRCPVLLDTGLISKKSYGVIVKPTGVLIGMDTTDVYTHVGYKKGDEDSIKAEILKWMPAPKVSAGR
jgi:peroxiredoxin